MTFSGLSPDGALPEIVEIQDHPWFIGVQFHPESISTEKGKQLYVNRISVTGNKVTRDKVVRREIDFEKEFCFSYGCIRR
ncbi:glutamine amidotransferase-related protein, partial [Alteromonas abrolhosensis]|uniref:glutamine amidotransferase-related protein n=1 Tax=Alteromonas abrolhosensis TaxID=1892904 RepID=UPI003BAA1BF9